MQENDDINTAYLKMIIDWMKMTRQFSLAAASSCARPNILERHFVRFLRFAAIMCQCPSGAHAWVTHKRGTGAVRGEAHRLSSMR